MASNNFLRYVYRYINDILPCVFRSSEAVEDPAWKTLWAVLKKHHRYAVMFTAEGDAAKDLAVYKWLQLLSIQAMLMFVLAVFFTFQVRVVYFYCKIVSQGNIIYSLCCFHSFLRMKVNVLFIWIELHVKRKDL